MIHHQNATQRSEFVSELHPVLANSPDSPENFALEATLKQLIYHTAQFQALRV
jgi:hypothetical protein